MSITNSKNIKYVYHVLELCIYKHLLKLLLNHRYLQLFLVTTNNNFNFNFCQNHNIMCEYPRFISKTL